MRLALTAAARRAGQPDETARWRRHGPGGGDVAARRQPARSADRTSSWQAAGRACSGDEPLGPGRRDQRAAGARRPRRARGARSRRTTPARASTTSTRRRSAARSAGRPSTTSRGCGALERELERQGYLAAPRRRARADAEGRPPARARPRCAGCSPRCTDGRRGDHDIHDAGAAGELTGATRAWRFGDEQPLDVVRTVANAVRRGGLPPAGRRGSRAAGRRRLRGARDRAPYVGRGLPARRPVVLDGAQRHLGRREDDGAGAARAGVVAVYPQDAVQVIGFANYARVLQPDGADRARLGHGAGHQPPARADARGTLPRQAPGRRAGRAAWSPTASRRRT